MHREELTEDDQSGENQRNVQRERISKMVLEPEWKICISNLRQCKNGRISKY